MILYTERTEQTLYDPWDPKITEEKNFTWNERLCSYNKPQEQKVNTDQYDKR